MSVTGPIKPDVLDVVDAHNHLWIEEVQDVPWDPRG